MPDEVKNGNVSIREVMWTRENLAWLAGLIEGEGYIKGPGPTSTSIQLAMASTDRDVLSRAVEIMTVGRVTGPYLRKNHPEYKPSYRFSLSGRKAYAVIVAVFPWLCERRQQAARQALVGWSLMRVANQETEWCVRGHLFTHLDSRGERVCRRCQHARSISEDRRVKRRQKAKETGRWM